jgi:hypothetical protein
MKRKNRRTKGKDERKKARKEGLKKREGEEEAPI